MTEITEGTIHAYVYREGLLSAVGHDLRLTLERFEIVHGEGDVKGRFWPESFRVDGAVRDGTVDAQALDDSDRAEIRTNLRDDVLQVDQYPEIRFDGQYERAGDEVWDVAGELEVVGVWETVRTRVGLEEGRLRATVELTPSRWGIEPYRALFGGLRLRDSVELEFDVSAGELPS